MSQPKSATDFILRGLFLPFSRQNLLLSFKPSQFFYELSRVSGYPEKTLRDTMSRATRDGYIVMGDTIPQLTAKGLKKVQPFVAEKLPENGQLLVVFDIPEERKMMRHEFRRLLKRLDFQYVQQSVWMSDLDHRKVLAEAVKKLELKDCVKVYEAAPIKL